MSFPRWKSFDVRFLCLFALILGAGWGFFVLASEVSEGETQAFDEAILRYLASLMSPKAAEIARDVTSLGSFVILTFVTACVTGGLFLARRRRAALGLATSVLVCGVLNGALKSLYARPRPSVVQHLTEVSGESFPSGHSMAAAAVYLTIATFVASTLAKRRFKIGVMTLAGFVVIAIGVSRCFLGVHYPSDVFGGWLVGSIFALISRLVSARVPHTAKPAATANATREP